MGPDALAWCPVKVRAASTTVEALRTGSFQELLKESDPVPGRPDAAFPHRHTASSPGPVLTSPQAAALLAGVAELPWRREVGDSPSSLDAVIALSDLGGATELRTP